MALYYLKESDDGGTPAAPTALVKPKNVSSPILSIAFGTIILLATFVQLLGLTWPLEVRLLKVLPATWITKVHGVENFGPKIALLEMSPGEEAFPAMDVAMALRGLGKLHPSRIMIAGKVTSDKESEQLLLGVLSTLRAEGINVIKSQAPTAAARYHSIPLCRYDPPNFFHLGTHWVTLPGSISNKEQGCFLPFDLHSSGTSQFTSESLQLFAKTAQGEVVGSTWWHVIEEEVAGKETGVGIESPSTKKQEVLWLLSGRLLLIPNRSPLVLTADGSLRTKTSSPINSSSLEDFLLHAEQKERGEPTSSYDTAWNDALVILGKKSDQLSLSILQKLASKLAWKHLPWSTQLLLCTACIGLLVTGQYCKGITSLIIALFLMLGTLAAIASSLSHGILFPWLTPAVTTLFLIISGLLRKRDSGLVT